MKKLEGYFSLKKKNHSSCSIDGQSGESKARRPCDKTRADNSLD